MAPSAFAASKLNTKPLVIGLGVGLGEGLGVGVGVGDGAGVGLAVGTGDGVGGTGALHPDQENAKKQTVITKIFLI